MQVERAVVEGAARDGAVERRAAIAQGQQVVLRPPAVEPLVDDEHDVGPSQGADRLEGEVVGVTGPDPDHENRAHRSDRNGPRALPGTPPIGRHPPPGVARCAQRPTPSRDVVTR